MMIGKEEEKLFPLIEFALGIELAQLVIVTSILAITFAIINLLKLKKEYWIALVSIFVAIISSKMMWERIFW